MRLPVIRFADSEVQRYRASPSTVSDRALGQAWAMISASAQPKSVLMITIGMAGRASLIFSTVSARSMLFPVETKTAILNVACCASKIASSPLLTVITLHPVLSRHCRISSHESADTSRTLSPFEITAEFIDSTALAGTPQSTSAFAKPIAQITCQAI